MAYKSWYKVKDKNKWILNKGEQQRREAVLCRSNWERQVCKWAERNPDILKVNLEGIVIPYVDRGTGKKRRYFMDFYMMTTTGETWIIEVKPKNQKSAPRKRKKVTRKYLNEIATYATNTSKWQAAAELAKLKGWKFFIWTEDELRSLGMKII